MKRERESEQRDREINNSGSTILEDTERERETTMTEEIKIGKIITFSGKKVEWSLWSEKFLARANRKGYKCVLMGTEEAPDDTVKIEDEKDSAKQKRLTELRKLNEEAYEDLVLAVDGKSSIGRSVFSLIKGSKSKEFAEGSAREA